MKEVWIGDPNYHKIRRSFALIFSKNYQCFEKLYLSNTRKSISSDIQTLRSWLKKLGCASFFNPLLSVWISDETLFLVFDILLLKCDVSIAVVDIVNEAHQHLRIPLYGEQSFRCLEKTNSTHFWKKRTY